jgi:hypothetical protein
MNIFAKKTTGIFLKLYCIFHIRLIDIGELRYIN